MSSSNGRPTPVSSSGSPILPALNGSRPPSITRSSRENFSPSFETLPSEKITPKEIKEVLPKINNKNGEGIGKQDEVNTTDSFVVEEDEPESEYERKVRKGLEKIKRLDEVLSEKLQQEKELKRERRAFERDFQHQVQSYIEDKGTEKLNNTEQLLTLLSLSSDHPSEKIDDNYNSIFSTQIDPDFYNSSADETSFRKKCSPESPSKKSPEQKNTSKGNFIKRNIELANQANETVKLTDDEKKRLEELLSDDNDLLLVENPFSERTLAVDNAFTHSDTDSQALCDIDEKLKDFISDAEMEILNKINEKYSFLENNENEGKEKKKKKKGKKSAKNQHAGSDDMIHVKMSVEGFNTIGNDVDCGEEVLQEKKIQRTLHQRLKDIDRELKSFHMQENEEEEERIDPDLLRKLLESDSRLTSSAVSICESVFSNAESMLMSDSLNGSRLGESWNSLKEITVSE